MQNMKRLVIKIGTSTLTGGGPGISARSLLNIVQQAAALHEGGAQVILVSSGAMAAGREALGIAAEPAKAIPFKQMLAAAGQPRLMHLYSDLFGLFGLTVAQVLLTVEDFSHRTRYLNARDALGMLLHHRIIPIINENDAVATEEIKVGDNDNLSALVANLVDADLLILLTDQPGLFTTDPRRDPQAQLIPLVERIDDQVWAAAGGAGTQQGTGGMLTKLSAARLATRSGVGVVVAQGSRPNVLIDLVGPQGRSIGTWFAPGGTHLESRKRWLLSEPPHGTLIIDDGAAAALRGGAVSLLPVGVRGVEGGFSRGMVVSINDLEGHELARGLANYAAADLARLCGAKSAEISARLGFTYGDEAVHRDNLVML